MGDLAKITGANQSLLTLGELRNRVGVGTGKGSVPFSSAVAGGDGVGGGG